LQATGPISVTFAIPFFIRPDPDEDDFLQVIGSSLASWRTPFQSLDIYRVARELARRVHAAKIRDRELRDQATRASKSCFLCLCEGLPNDGAALRHKYFVEARNSLAETVGAMDLAAAIGVVRQDDSDAIQELGSRLRRMLTALLR